MPGVPGQLELHNEALSQNKQTSTHSLSKKKRRQKEKERKRETERERRKKKEAPQKKNFLLGKLTLFKKQASI